MSAVGTKANLGESPLEIDGDGIELVQLGGIEPPASCSTNRRSNHLSYNCARGVLDGQKIRRLVTAECE
jgi:hypothetical protein